MKNFWKRFAGLGTEFGASLPDIYISARWRIGMLYFFTSIVVMLLGGKVIDVYIRNGVIAGLRDIGQPELEDAIIQSITQGMVLSIWTLRLGIALATAIIAVFLSDLTLRPIRQALDSQRRFVSNASHELRTPLAIMRANTDVALASGEKLSRDEAREALRSSLEEIDRMNNTLQILLSFSGYENRVSSLMMSRVSLEDVARRSVDLMRPRADAKTIFIAFGSKGMPIVRGNAAALEEMISNLVRNAITYTPPGGNIGIFLAPDSGRSTVLTVRDSGIGIPEEDLPHIFEPFYRGSNSSSGRKTGSAGLGLAIVREIARLHGAKVEVHSDRKIGTTFFVHFRTV